MLRRPEAWNVRAEIPFASDPGVWLLTDEGPSHYAIPTGATRIPRSQLAATLRYDRGRLFTVPPSPQIRNFCARGIAASAVLVVTQQILQPLDAEPSSCIVIVDLRPLQLGMTWVLAPSGLFSLESFAEDLDYPCPRGFQLTAEGAPRVFSRPGCVLRVVDGSRVTVACVQIPPGTVAQAHRFAHSDRSETDSEYSDGVWETSSSNSQASLGGGGGQPPAGPPPPEPREPQQRPQQHPADVLIALALSLSRRAVSSCGLLGVVLCASPVPSAGVVELILALPQSKQQHSYSPWFDSGPLVTCSPASHPSLKRRSKGQPPISPQAPPCRALSMGLSRQPCANALPCLAGPVCSSPRIKGVSALSQAPSPIGIPSLTCNLRPSSQNALR